MTDERDDARSVSTLPGVVVSAVAIVAITETMGRWVTVGALGSGVDATGFVLVALSIVVGRPALLGSAIGLLVVGILFGSWSGGVIQAAAGFVLTVIAIQLWHYWDGDRRVGLPEWLLRYGVVATVAVLAFAATGAWLSDVMNRAAFGVVAGQMVVTTLPLALLGAPLVRPIAHRASERRWRVPGNPTTRRSRVILATTVVSWVLAGYVGSHLFRVLALAPPGSVGRRISPTIETFVTIWGWQGTYAQLLLGLVALIIIAREAT